ncbi:MAG: hypothetical protein D3923_01295 [Candidatus Electrothrix sp. AR3]|nr:hypothetical protein [Candidatus Electrothrix sp. AR3]
MVVYERDKNGNITTWIETTDLGIDNVCADNKVPSSLSTSIYDNNHKYISQDALTQYTPYLIVLSDDFSSWDTSPACSEKIIRCSSKCGTYAHQDFDETWGPLTAPSDLKLILGWKTNGCRSLSGRLDFYVVPDVCESSGTNIYTVTGDLGFAIANFTTSPEIDISGILSPSQTYYIRVIERSEDNGSCGGDDYNIHGFGVFSANSNSEDTDEDGVVNTSDICPETAPNTPVLENGCSLNQQCPCDAAWKDHDAYVHCNTVASEELVTAGLITDEEKNTIMSEIKLSHCGKRNYNLSSIIFLLLNDE